MTQQSKGQPESPSGAVGPPSTDPAVAAAELPKVHKNDAVNRFWASVEPYCAPITPDDLKYYLFNFAL